MEGFDIYSPPAYRRYRMEVGRTASDALTAVLYEWVQPGDQASRWRLVKACHWKADPGATFNSVLDVLDTGLWVLSKHE